MSDDVEFTPWEGDLDLTPSCGECGALVADVETHRKYHDELNQRVLKAIREDQRKKGVPTPEQRAAELKAQLRRDLLAELGRDE